MVWIPEGIYKGNCGIIHIKTNPWHSLVFSGKRWKKEPGHILLVILFLFSFGFHEVQSFKNTFVHMGEMKENINNHLQQESNIFSLFFAISGCSW